MKCEYYDSCTGGSLTVDGKETIDMSEEEFRAALKRMIDKVDDFAVLQSLFMNIMESCGECEDLGQCGQCGDWNYKYTWKI